MAKLTLSVDEEVIRRAKDYATQHNTSVSAVVEKLLDSMTRLPDGVDDLPVLRRLKGALAGADVDLSEYRDHLVQKHS